MRTFVTGGTGFVGKHLIDRLVHQGHAVRALVRPRPRSDADPVASLRKAGVEVVEGTLTDAAVLTKAVAGTDVVFHLAWQANRMSGPGRIASSAEEQHKANVQGCRALIEACRAACISRFVYTSTVSVYGAASVESARPVREDDLLARSGELHGRYWTGYAGPKIAVEELIQRLLPEPDYVILRPAMVYGAGAQFARSLVDRMTSGGPPSIGSHTIQWVHVQDLVTALMLAAARTEAANDVFNICGAEPVSTAEFQAAIRWLRQEALAGSGSGEPLPCFRLVQPKYDISKSRERLEFVPSVPFAEGLHEMVTAEVNAAPERPTVTYPATHRSLGTGRGPAPVARMGHTSEALRHNERLNRFYRWHQALERDGSFFGGSDFWNFGLWDGAVQSQREACENLMERLLSFIPAKVGRILDVACGKGGTTTYLLNYYPSERIVAINISEDQLEVCRTKAPEVDFQLMDAANMSFEDCSFENIICVEAACHFHTREAFLREAYRILKPGGRLVLSDCLMTIDSPTQPRQNYVGNLDEYREAFKRAGFEAGSLHDATEACWHGFRDSLAEFARTRLEGGEGTQQQYLGTLDWLRRTEPVAYVVGWCEKRPGRR